MQFLHCAIIFIFSSSAAACHLYRLSVFPLQALSLIKRGIIKHSRIELLKDFELVVSAANKRALLNFRELREKLIALSNIIQDEGTFGIVAYPTFEACRIYLGSIPHFQSNLEDIAKKDWTLFESLRKRWRILSEVMDIMVDEPENTSVDLGNPINELIESLDLLIPQLNLEDAEYCMDSIRGMDEVRTKLHEYFKLNPSELGTINAKLIALDNLYDFANEIASKNENEVVSSLEEVQWFFDGTSLVSKYIDEETRPNVDLKQLGMELRALAVKTSDEQFKQLLAGEFNFFSTFVSNSSNRLTPQNLDPDISDLTDQVAHYLKGMDMPDLFMRIYEKYEEIKAIIVPESHYDEMDIRDRALEEVRILFILYLLGLERRPEAFKAIYKDNRDKIAALTTSAIEMLGISSKEYDNPFKPGDSESIPDMEMLFSILDEKVTKVLEREIPLQREVLLDKSPGDGEVPQYKEKGIQRGFLFIYSREISGYLDREREALESIVDDDPNIAAAQVVNRMDLVKKRLGISPSYCCPQRSEFKAFALDVLGGFRKSFKQEKPWKTPNLALASFYHRYVFPKVHQPIDEIQREIGHLIKNLESYLKVEQYDEPGFMGGNSVLLSEQWTIVMSSLQFFKERFDHMTAFPGIGLFPHERGLYNVSAGLYPKVVDGKSLFGHNYLDTVWGIFCELLWTLENWKIYIDYRKEADFFNESKHKEAIEQSKLKKD